MNTQTKQPEYDYAGYEGHAGFDENGFPLPQPYSVILQMIARLNMESADVSADIEEILVHATVLDDPVKLNLVRDKIAKKARQKLGDLDAIIARARVVMDPPEDVFGAGFGGAGEGDDDDGAANPFGGPGAGSSGRGNASNLPPWASDMLLGDDGEPLSNVHNAVIALAGVPEIAEALKYDKMLCAPVLVKPLDGSGAAAGAFPRKLTDIDATDIQQIVQRSVLPKLGKDVCYQAIEQHASANSFHPVREYLDGLVWDDVARLDTWVSAYLGAADTPYARGVGAMWLISMVARVMQPGCKVDTAPVLEGDQGKLKSTVCSILAGQWFSDALPDIHSKDASSHLRGKWLIEIAELAAFRKADIEKLKAYITRRVEQFRPAYGRLEVEEPRQCVFVGTTNRDQYLGDDTGGRRFWPLSVGQVKIDQLRADRDQLFAEATARYKAGEKWWPDEQFAVDHAAPEQTARQFEEAWAVPIERAVREWIAMAKATPAPNYEFPLYKVAKEALKIEDGRIGTATNHRIRAALKALGCYERTGADGKRVRGTQGRTWLPPDAWIEETPAGPKGFGML